MKIIDWRGNLSSKHPSSFEVLACQSLRLRDTTVEFPRKDAEFSQRVAEILIARYTALISQIQKYED